MTEKTGQLITKRRKEKSLSQAELAEMIHVTDKAVSRWETGRGMPSVELLETLAQALDLSVEELLSGTEGRPAVTPDWEYWKNHPLIKWPCWLAAAVASLALPVLFFLARLHLTSDDLSINLMPLVAGILCGGLVSLPFLLKKTSNLLAVLALSVLVLWFLVPGNGLAASLLLGAGAGCSLGSLPFFASRLLSLMRRFFPK